MAFGLFNLLLWFDFEIVVWVSLVFWFCVVDQTVLLPSLLVKYLTMHVKFLSMAR